MAEIDARAATGSLFVSFEGGEGAGKSTQIDLLRVRLEESGLRVVTTREPGGSHTAEDIRYILLSGHAKRYGSVGETILFSAARRDHVDTLIAPALARGAIVLCDRFVDSTRVYQGAVAGLEGKLLSRLEAAATSGRMPDLTIVIDVPVAIGFERARRRREARGEATDRFESESLAFHEKVRAAFLALAAAEPERCVVVDGAGSAEDAGAAIWSAVTAHLVGRA